MATASSQWTFKASPDLIACGIDSERIRRFSRFVGQSGHPMPFVFTKREVAYARSLPDRAAQLCASFCCKEALRKALREPYNFDECELLADLSTGAHAVKLSDGLREASGVTRALAVALTQFALPGELTVAVYCFGQSGANT